MADELSPQLPMDRSRFAAAWRWLRARAPRLLLELALLLAIVWGLEAFLTRHAVRGPAPPIEAATLEGRPFSLKGFAGRPALIHFWATWCPVCGLEQGSIEGLAQDHPVITVAMQSGDAAEVAAWMREEGVAYPVLNDPEGRLSARYGVQAVPASFVIDGEGRVRFVTHGYTSGWGLRLRLWAAGW